MSERLRREADSGLCKGWMLLPVAERNAIFSELCLRSRLPDSRHFEVEWGRTPVPGECIRQWVKSLSGQPAVNGVWALVLPMLLNMEKRRMIPAGWCEDESGWLLHILDLAMRGPKKFDTTRKVPFAFFLTRRIVGNCSSKMKRIKEQSLRTPAVADEMPDVRGWPIPQADEDEREVRALLSRLGGDGDDGRLRSLVEASLAGARPVADDADLREIRRVMFSAR